MSRFIPGMLAVLAACAPSVPESVVSEQQSVDLDAGDLPVLLVVVLDDSFETLDVWAFMDNATQNVHREMLERHPAFEQGFLSSYTDVAPRWMGGGLIDGSQGLIPYAYDISDAWDDGIIRRDSYAPSPRAALANAIEAGLLPPPEELPPTIFFFRTAFDDHSPGGDEVDVVRTYLEATRYGSGFGLAHPQGAPCRGPASTEREGHAVTLESLVNVRLLWDNDVCVKEPFFDSLSRLEPRHNRATFTVPQAILPESITVWGLTEDGAVPIDADQAELRGTELFVGPPIAQFPSIEVRYEVRVE